MAVRPLATSAGRACNQLPQLGSSSNSLGSSVLALEYWCDDDEPLWHEREADLVRRASDEIVGTGLVNLADIADGRVMRVQRSYPVYTRDYSVNLAPIVAYLNTIPNLWPLGRYGSFKYNNQDHSILMGLLAAENIASGAHHDLWGLNSDSEYQEDSLITEQGLMIGGRTAQPPSQFAQA